jgi:hypothetical protein
MMTQETAKHIAVANTVTMAELANHLVLAHGTEAKPMSRQAMKKIHHDKHTEI